LLLCPLVDTFEEVNKPENLPKRNIIWRSESFDSIKDDTDVKVFLDMAVIATPEILEKYIRDILSGINISDKDFLSCYNGGYNPDMEKTLRTVKFDKPTCIITGRKDDAVGYYAAYKILDRFPRATFTVLDCAGHNLQIDNELVFIQLVKDWIWRIELDKKIDK
jgi:pimeloyl-ACP methyl ester carboxylesterase